MRSSILLIAASAISAVAAHSMGGGDSYGIQTRSAKAHLQLLARSLDEEEAADLVARYYDDLEEREELEERDDHIPHNFRRASIMCRICHATFLSTTRAPMLAQHASSKHGATLKQCFP